MKHLSGTNIAVLGSSRLEPYLWAVLCCCWLAMPTVGAQTTLTTATEPTAARTIAATTPLPTVAVGSVDSTGYTDTLTTSPASPPTPLPSRISDRLRKPGQRLTVFGYYRLFLYGRTFSEPYPGLSPFERTYSVGDGYREPMLSLNVLGRPNGRSSFGSELFFFTPYSGTGTADNVFSVNLGLNFYGNFRTDAGNFGIRAGGIHWYNLSPFTIGVFQVLDRFTIFDRTPWEGVNNTDKYEAYFRTGATSPGDLRWNNQAFHGLILNGGKLPADFAFDLFWGKMQPNGGLANALTDPQLSVQQPGEAGNIPTYQGFGGDRRILPSYITGGRLAKNLGAAGQVGLNTLYSHTTLDSVRQTSRNYQVHSLNFNLNLAKLNVVGEFGGSKFESPITPGKWGEALMLRIKSPAEYTFLPLDVQVYQVSKDFFNENGEILTTGNPDIQKNFSAGIASGQGTVGGPLTLMNQLAHNRRGLNINTGTEISEVFKFNVGWGIAQELEALSSQLSYIHRVNGLALSRVYNPFPANATSATVFGPYQRQVSFFRGVFEVVQTTDLNPGTAQPLTRKYYNVIDLQAKFKTTLGRRPLYLFYLGNFNSAKSSASFLPNLTEDSYLFVRYHELDLYYELLPKFILAGYFGLERAQGGQFTEWGETDLPRDQTGIGIGAGFDWLIGQTSGLYFRYRNFDFEDRNFTLDRYRGDEVTIELKTFF